jgi:predicted CoA-binding protein
MPTIAVIGASSDRKKFGNKCVRAYARRGWTIYPVNPNETSVEGLTAYKTIGDVPAEALDRVSVYLPPAIGVKVMDEVAKKKVGELWLNPGADGPEVVKRARDLGLNAVAACSIVDIGISPSELGDR